MSISFRLSDRTARNLKAYFRVVLRYSSAWAFAFPGTLLAVAMRLPMPLLTGYVIDRVISGRDAVTLNRIGAGLVAFTVLYQGLNYAVDYLGFRIRQSIVIRLRTGLLRHVHNLPLSKLAGKETGYLMARISQDPGFVNGLGAQLMSMLSSVITFVVGLTAIFAINARVAAISLALVPLFGASFLAFQKRIRLLDEQHKEQTALVSRGLKESLSHIPSVKLFVLQSRECVRYLRSLRTELAISLRAFNCEYAVSAASGFFAAMGPLFVVWVGGHEVMQNRLTVGQLVACSSLLGFLYGPTRAIVSSNVGFVRALVSLGRVFDILEEAPERHEVRSPSPAPQPQDFGIELDRVWFEYAGSVAVLKRVSLSIPSGSSVAIVGPIGAGKSTLLGLIPRLYDPTSGRVLIGGHDVRTMPLNELRSYVSVASQTPFLVSASIYENIRLGDPRASHVDILQAAERANAWSFIRSLPKGLETEVGENGCQLSGGQKQLVCLARILLRGSPILILDEPTSSVDPGTERLMQESLAAFMKGRTTLVVSHRLSSVLKVERVVILEDGRIADQGTHSELAGRNQFYSQLVAYSPEALAI